MDVNFESHVSPKRFSINTINPLGRNSNAVMNSLPSDETKFILGNDSTDDAGRLPSLFIEQTEFDSRTGNLLLERRKC